jgi:DNA primase catalytic core
MYITNVDEVVPVLRSRLRDYITLKLKTRSNARKIKCFVHDDSTPSMHFNPKNNDETVKCFSCGWSGDIFAVAAYLDNLPSSGAEWITHTIPKLCQELDIPIKLGQPSLLDKEKIRQYKLCQDITDILTNSPELNKDFVDSRNWNQPDVTIASVAQETIKTKLIDLGWSYQDIVKSTLLSTKNFSFFGEDRVTIPIKDHLSRPIGFITRPLKPVGKLKYINSVESCIYEKGKALLGIDIAKKHIRKQGVYIVEGPGDLIQLYRLGIYNAVAVCGVALTPYHLTLLKSLGCSSVYLNFDWDDSGRIATQRVLENVIKEVSGFSVSVLMKPEGKDVKDPDDLLKEESSPKVYLELKKQSAFEWQLHQISDNESPDIICRKMIPSISAEPAAIKREILIGILSEFTGISTRSIFSDVESVRNNKFQERKEMLSAQADKYIQSVQADPDNIMAHLAEHERTVERIEKEYKRASLGVNYQISRYEAVQDLRRMCDGDENSSTFKMNHFGDLQVAMAGGQNWTSGCLMYVGGRANSGKTATVLMIGCDIALSDENALVIIHSTDDSYDQIEPRIKSNIYHMGCIDHPALTIGMIVQPHIYLKDAPEEYTRAYGMADDLFKQLISEERIVVIDAEDGSTLTVLERNIRYYRQKYPSKKIMVICDNTHNYMDFLNMDQNMRMTMISNQQKNLTAKYKCCMIATAEYRKNMPMDHSKFKLPVDDDLADARALMYRPNVIFHVYNDLHDRKDHAEIFWSDDEGKVYPRLLLHFTKNKISGFKEKLVLDLDITNIFLDPIDPEVARKDTEKYIHNKENNVVSLADNRVIIVEATEYQESQSE